MCFSLFIFRGHSTREPASGRMTYFILRAGENEEPESTWNGMDMIEQQSNDSGFRDMEEQLESGKAGGALKKRYTVMEGLFYYWSDPDDDPEAWLYIPDQIQDAVVRQYHDDNWHVDIDKTFEARKRKYYFPNLYQRLTGDINVS